MTTFAGTWLYFNKDACRQKPVSVYGNDISILHFFINNKDFYYMGVVNKVALTY